VDGAFAAAGSAPAREWLERSRGTHADPLMMLTQTLVQSRRMPAREASLARHHKPEAT
jgi:hypothetical protein